ncbi:MAG: ABC transporter substrate-binding protein [Rhodocyclaceae bacterium]|nr:ABC transporter substrate-binding protein [Rhodocyclaceae bacterium]
MSRFARIDRTFKDSFSSSVYALRLICVFCIALGWGYPSFAQMATVRVALVQSASDAPFFIADKRGYFEHEGIKVAFSILRDVIAPLGTGQLDVGATSTSAGLYNAVERGINVKIVADKGSTPPGYGYQPILVRKDLIESGKVKTFADFKGLKVAGFNKGSASMSTLNEALAIGGLKLSDINVVFMPFPQHVLALANGAVDASITVEPLATEAVKRGAAVRFASDDVIYPNHQLAVVMYGGDFIRDQPEVAKKFMRAYIRGVRYYNDALKDGRLAGPNAEDVIAMLTEYTSIKDPEVFRTITPNGVNPDGEVNLTSLKKDLEFYKTQSLVTSKITVDQAVDKSFVEAAVKDLGPYIRR